jgi:hypothetical protein
VFDGEDGEEITDIQTWTTGNGVKGCPKATAYDSMEYGVVDKAGTFDPVLSFETYTFNYLKPQFRAPLDSTKTKTIHSPKVQKNK